ncbi:hypothetical protein IFM12275_03390 [Nocardia sputorum]|uniref:DUF4142 domain-containing protein n=1 Tax=Nocardia sputorum TaxID=2984338 RepID=UPI00249012B3|nr:DUF4142 domain-containing protein [Nocardia sputorum]BDT90363.1 hypothetical protein IFM12275_03390 [Nocardia sputorum]
MRSLRRLLAPAALVAGLGLCCAPGSGYAAPVALGGQDSTYLTVSHQSHMAEIISGARAAPIGACPQVREIGAMLVSDHTRLDAMGAAIALPNGVVLPLTPNPDHTQQLLSTGMKMGRDFDLAWLTMQENFHIQALQAGAVELSTGESEQVTALARDAEPIIEHHLMLIRDARTRC